MKIYWNEPDELLDKVTAFHVPEPAAGKRVADCRESAVTFDENANYELIPGSLTYYRSVDESLSAFTDTFSPNNKCTRAQVVTFLYQASSVIEP